MDITFGTFTFRLCAGRRAAIVLSRGESPIAECALTGQNKLSRDGKHVPTAEGEALCYHAHRLEGDVLEIEQRSRSLRSVMIFRRYPDSSVLRVSHRICNLTKETLGIAQVSSFVLYGIAGDGISSLKRTRLSRFCNSWHCECQPRTASLFEAGLYSSGHASFRRVCGCNKGGWSSKEELPQAILERRGGCFMFEIESPNDWYWEMGECDRGIYLYTGGADAWEHEWEVRLAPGECYETPATAVCFGESSGEVLAEMTKYRRHLLLPCTADGALPVVFNDYMHLSWDSPSEERTRKMVPVAAALGAEIYVIDCGWHNEEDGDVIYPYVGQWRESKKRFPHGIRSIVEEIHRHGMKAGLWLEPEVVGQACTEMIDAYPPEAWFCRDGKPVIVGGRRFLDYRCKAVCDYMDGVVDRIVQEYGADYLKFDYNQDCGSGTDTYGDKPGRGLELATQAFFAWVAGVRRRYPALIIEGCASGGQRLDYASTAQWSLISSSDQTDYRKYPWIAANIFAAVLPEQAGVWSYPVDSWVKGFCPTEDWVRGHVSDETVIMNMVNAMLGRIHLASHIELLGEGQQALVREGIALMKQIAPFKRRAVPFFPNGFARFGDKSAACGLMADGELYLAVWSMGGKGDTVVHLGAFASARCEAVYPRSPATDFVLANGILRVTFPQAYAARLFRLTLWDKR